MTRSRSSDQGARGAVLAGLVLLLAAGVFDAAPLYVPAVAFVLLGMACVAWVASGARGLRIERELGSARVVEGEPLTVRLVVSTDRVAVPACVVEDALLEHPVAVPAARGSAVVGTGASFPRRGRHALAPPRAVVADPLGLAVRVVEGATAGGPQEVLVLPRIERVVPAPGLTGHAGTVTRRARPGVAPAAEVDLDGLRPHREGAAASRIHWPAFARTGELLERHLRPEGDTRPLVLLDSRSSDPALLDAAVRAAASLCVHLAGLGGCALLLPGDRRPAPLEPGLAGWAHLHARLAVVEPGGAPALSGLAARRGAIFYVAARALPRLPAVLTLAPAAGRVLVEPVRHQRRRVAFTVAGCFAHDLEPARGRGTRATRRRAAAGAR